MKAAVLVEVNKPLVIEDVSLQKPGPREVLIRTSVAGLCHSDLHFMEGLYPHPLPAVLGHESAGIVEQVGSDVTYVKPGDHVVPGKVMCIIESMKLMNEIEAEVSGTVVARLVENGHPVEYGEALFSVRPS